MKVCMLAYTWYESDGRVRRYAEALAKRGDHVDALVLGKPGQERRAVLHGVHIYRIQNRTKNEKSKFSYALKLLWFLATSSCYLIWKHLQKRFELIHVHSVPDFEVFAAWLPKLTGAKIILDIHDIVPELYASKFGARQGSWIYKALLLVEKLATAFADHVIIANHLWQRRLIARAVHANKCSVFLNYPDPAIFYARPRKNQSGKFTLIYPGTLSKHQGIELAIKAVGLIKDREPDIELHLYGSGTDEEYFKNMVAALELRDRVCFKGLVSLEEVAEKMANADLGLEPKLGNAFSDEALSTKILEFIMLGVPVIASNTTIHKHYYDESVLAFFKVEDEIDLAHCLLRLKGDPARRAALAAEAKKLLAKHNWESKRHEYLELVDALVHAAGRSQPGAVPPELEKRTAVALHT